jgi:murein DD-endopeptidase MepM/ murein hydrolase activator NlpD
VYEAQRAALQNLQAFIDAAMPGAVPLAGPAAAGTDPPVVKPVEGQLTSRFGPRWGTNHNGIDIKAPIGTPIKAVSGGEVINAGAASGFGQWVRVRHTNGTISVYGHVDTYTVKVGQQVRAGDLIATVGNRGQSTGPHLHLEIIEGGKKIDPLPWLKARGVDY